MKFKVGDKVWWSSQAAASRTLKSGEIVAVVPAGEYPFETPWLGKSKMMYGPPNMNCTGRNHESYLVEVKHGDRAKPRLYWPRVSQLEIIP